MNARSLGVLPFALALASICGCSSSDFTVATTSDDASGDDVSVDSSSADSAPGDDSTVDDTATTTDSTVSNDSAGVDTMITVDGGSLDGRVDGGSDVRPADGGSEIGAGDSTVGSEIGPVDTGSDAGGCYTNVNCITGQFCFRTSCDAPGVCQAPPSGVANYGPVCGCNGVTYWNAFSAATSSVATRHVGVCADAERKPCSDAAACAVAGGNECVFELANIAACALPTGSCWSNPAGQICPAGASGHAVRACNGACTSHCLAVSSNNTKFYADGSCPP